MSTGDLFAHARREEIAQQAPLAARMRPRTLDEFVGQEHIVGPGRLLRRAIQADQLSSLIFYGPPGTGKTTLAMVIANTTRSVFVTLNAVLAGVKDIRQVTAQAQDLRNLYGQRTILFVDEVHRWNKAQQDALLPWVENGAIVMIGATTENPWFSVNRALLSRSRVFQLRSLNDEDLRAIALQALADRERGYGQLSVEISSEVLDHLINVANGDARSVLNALELAVETTEPSADGHILVTMAVAEESIQQRAVLYDQEGDYHFDTISAFIKSVRGSDPDATLYWLAKMVYAGEDPRFIFRRLMILASEDIGLADPHALVITEAAAAAFDRVGLPEGRFHLAQAALYLATAPKSNSSLGFFEALSTVEKEPEGEVPTHLKDASRDQEGFGHGEGYLYPHAYRDHWVAQQYLPAALQGHVFYSPSDQGYEAGIATQVARRREEQLAAMVETEASDALTYSPTDRARERWLQRTISNAGEQLGQIRDRIFAQAQIKRHHIVLDLNASTGLLTWEALRLTPEGGIWAFANDERTAQALDEQARRLAEIERPMILHGRLADLGKILETRSQSTQRFDRMVGRNSLMAEPNKRQLLEKLAEFMQPDGLLCLAESIPREAQRLHALINLTSLEEEFAERVRSAEEAIYRDSEDPMLDWDASALEEILTAAGFTASVDTLRMTRDVLLTPAQLDRWFATAATSGSERPSFALRLAPQLSNEELALIEHLFRRQLSGQTCSWSSTVAFVVAKRTNH